VVVAISGKHKSCDFDCQKHKDALFWRFCLMFMVVDGMVNARFLATITDFVCCGLL